VVLGGQCGVNDNIFVGDDVIAGGATKIFTNVPAGRVLLGYPAVKMETHVEMHKACAVCRDWPRASRASRKTVSQVTGRND
jgi:UDP-3-O-[3-hydroxymyristoyl] glucosamine N-acyltransferase